MLLCSFVSTQSQVEILGSAGRIAFSRITTPSALFTSVIWRTDGTVDGTFPVTGTLQVSPGGGSSGW